MPDMSTTGFVCLLFGRRPVNDAAEGRITSDRAVFGVRRDLESRSNAKTGGNSPNSEVP
jgi:hypothetical protein